MSTLADIRKKLQTMDARSSFNKEGSNSDSTLYNHWDIPDNSSSIVRFLPDKDLENTFFWIERQQIKIPFPGIVGEAEQKEITVTVPCADMWGRNLCPIIQEISPWWDDPSLKELASKYWKKRTYLMQGFVIEDGMATNQVPSNVIKKFVMSPQIFKIIKATLLDPDMENIPVDFDFGTNFKINKTKSGKWAEYSTSAWVRKESALSQEQRSAIETQGLFNLSEGLPARPGDAELKAIYEMFEASVNGNLYDPARWSKFYKPFGLNTKGSKEEQDAPQAPAPKETPAPTNKAPEPAAPEEGAQSSSSKSAQEILDALRRRKANA